jgi:plastocyanin
MNKGSLFFLMVVIFSLAGCGSKEEPVVQNAAPSVSEAVPQQAAATASVSAALQGSGSLRGVVRVNGLAPDTEPLQMSADPYCAANADSGAINESLIVNPTGGMKNAFVYIKSGLEGRTFAPPAAAAVLDQQGCRYHPHVIGLQVGQPLEIVNSDSTLHNVHALPKASKEFNLGMPLKGMKIKKFFSAPEMGAKFKCDVHPWMSAYACVLAHPFFAVTGEDGSFELKNLPVGQYTLAVWHETMGEKEIKVTVTEGETLQDVSF